MCSRDIKSLLLLNKTPFYVLEDPHASYFGSRILKVRDLIYIVKAKQSTHKMIVLGNLTNYFEMPCN